MPPLAFVLAALALAAPAHAGPGMMIGAAEDAGKTADPVVAQAKMDLARLAGFDAIRMTAIWAPGETELTGYELLALRNAAGAAALNGIRVVVSVYNKGSKTTPRTPAAKLEFADFTASIAREIPTITHFIIGNEPNLNLFWMPQFNRNGTSSSPGAYLGLLAVTYDALKEVSPEIEVIGGSVSPRGQDKPRSKRQTHSPTRFITELGRAYRRSGRQTPVMDAFAFHPYGDNSSQPPEFRHHPLSVSIGISEYDKLVDLLGEAFDGTAQAGSELPILYDEYGVDTRIPFVKADFYTGREPKTTKPVNELKQGDYYRRALAIAHCQPTVVGLLFFHVSDEPDLDRWQSGIFYADDTPKASFETVKAAVEELRERSLSSSTDGIDHCLEVEDRLEQAKQEAEARAARPRTASKSAKSLRGGR
ncbi:MAG: hypothetical protein ACRDN6_07845 [Gaiellaceae bacterium]